MRLQLDILFRHFEKTGSIPPGCVNPLDAILNPWRHSGGSAPSQLDAIFRDTSVNNPFQLRPAEDHRYVPPVTYVSPEGLHITEEYRHPTAIVTKNRPVWDNNVVGFGSLRDSFSIDYENNGSPSVSNNCGLGVEWIIMN